MLKEMSSFYLGTLPGGGDRSCGDESGAALREHHARDQLPRVAVEEAVAECALAAHQVLHGTSAAHILNCCPPHPLATTFVPTFTPPTLCFPHE